LDLEFEESVDQNGSFETPGRIVLFGKKWEAVYFPRSIVPRAFKFLQQNFGTVVVNFLIKAVSGVLSGIKAVPA
jgi:hypothetical protein